ncbi:MAG: GerAB/ArcD/ProY family transporter [Bacilli bacterium]|nr:GerAB/ArcD/ProY family transporter [Bacilli bacterium]
MIKRKLTNFEFATLNYFVTRAFLVGMTFNALINVTKRDSWIIPLISIPLDILFIYIINKIIDYEPDLNLPQKLLKLFGKKIGTIIIGLICIFMLAMGILNYLTLNNFIQSQFLTRTPLLAVAIVLIITIFYILNKGINVIARTSNILFFINAFLFVISFTGLISSFDIANLKPIFMSSTNDYLAGINSYYAFHIAPMFLLTMIPKNKVNNPKIKSTLIISTIISSITMFCVIFATLATFGYELTALYEYPEFHVLKQATIVGATSRIESILVIQLIFDIFIYCTLILYFIGNSIKEITKFKKKNVIYFVLCILLLVGTVYAAKYNIYVDNLTKKIIPIISTIFTIVTTLIIYCKVKFNKLLKKK